MKKKLLIGMLAIYGCATTKPNNGLLIKDTEGNKHFYELQVRDGKYYCYVHQRYEQVKIK
jgi:hypothetical protein